MLVVNITDNADEDDGAELEMLNANHKSSFLNDKSPATLYLWEKADEFNLLNSVCQQLDSAAMLDSSGGTGAGDSDNQESTAAQPNKRKKDTSGGSDDALSGLTEMIENSNKQMEASNKQIEASNKQLEAATRAKREGIWANRLDAKRTRMYTIEDQVDDARDERRKRRLERRLEECEQRIADFENELKKIRAEGDRRGGQE